MLTFLALVQSKHADLQREFADLRRLRTAGERTPLEQAASRRRAQTLARLKAIYEQKGNERGQLRSGLRT
jgi:hypothetical protein